VQDRGKASSSGCSSGGKVSRARREGRGTWEDRAGTTGSRGGSTSAPSARRGAALSRLRDRTRLRSVLSLAVQNSLGSCGPQASARLRLTAGSGGVSMPPSMAKRTPAQRARGCPQGCGAVLGAGRGGRARPIFSRPPASRALTPMEGRPLRSREVGRAPR
jgi:hypothetical protein